MPTINSWDNQVLAAAVTFNGGTFSAGTDVATNAINIGTAGARTVTLGNTTGASILALKYGTGDFTLASASGTVISALDTGQVTKPLQPAFLATNTVSDTNVTGDGTVYTVIFNSVIFDQASNFNSGTGIFTAPVTGRYQFNFSASVNNLGAAHTLGEMIINTSNRLYDHNAYNWNPVAVAANQFGATTTTLADMDAGDTAKFQLKVSGSTKTIQVNGNALMVTIASGNLVC